MGNFYHQLGRIQPTAYVLLYIFLIFAFAGAYGSLPTGSFFHATMQHERENMLGEAQALLLSLEGYIRDEFIQRYGASVAEINDWRVNIDELDLRAIDLKEYTELSIVTITGSIPIRRGTVVSDTVFASLPLSLCERIYRQVPDDHEL